MTRPGSCTKTTLKSSNAFYEIQIMVKAFVLVASFFLVNAAHAADDSYDDKLEAANRYFEAAPVEGLWISMADKLSASMSTHEKRNFEKVMGEVDLTLLENLTREAMIKHFTLDEINALADFYGSPAGKSAMSKYGDYMADVGPALTAEINRAISEAFPRLQ
ncbi:DUF2059 domain-containing protein [Alcanivorax sp. 1008]|uniref:DUF2059 domain-containing protein n=1 Tax=Alcanivorax sp. 1008 TaxID=2816853 RepID=UPI001D6625FA|nr:DUF2059 domain-containing protein [Alcanivorax sp. 1008]MCC1496828.1 DUF2059 domain-containing protein [Alcanivorax sp. 1008]